MLVDITKDVTVESCEYTPEKPKAIVRPNRFSAADIAAAAQALNDSKKPFIMAGGGVIASQAEQSLRKFCLLYTSTSPQIRRGFFIYWG